MCTRVSVCVLVCVCLRVWESVCVCVGERTRRPFAGYCSMFQPSLGIIEIGGRNGYRITITTLYYVLETLYSFESKKKNVKILIGGRQWVAHIHARIYCYL